MLRPIRIENARITKNGYAIANYIGVPEPAHRKLFMQFHFTATYDRDISKVPLSILNIPVLASVIHFAWAVGVDVHIPELDEQYLKGLDKARRTFKNNPSYRSLSFNNVVEAKKTTNIDFEKKFKGLLFSGGVDSTSSYIAHRNENPKLIMMWGLDIPLFWRPFWKKVKETYRSLNLITVKTNSESMYHLTRLYTALGKGLVEGYRATYSYSINLLGLCAPVTFTHNIGELMLSSTYPIREYGDPNFPWSRWRVNPYTDPLMRWDQMKIKHVETEYSSTEKVKHFIKPYFEKYGSMPLRSCGHRGFLRDVKDKQLNCCLCDKCQRVIGMLIVNGIDPRTCGFPVTKKTFRLMKKDITTKKWDARYLEYHWREIQSLIPKIIKSDFTGSQEFLRWLRKWGK